MYTDGGYTGQDNKQFELKVLIIGSVTIKTEHRMI